MSNVGRPRGVAISVREAEVLAAVGERLTNAEIGARLFISIRTVESHVSSLLRKLQAQDRRALAAVAAAYAPEMGGKAGRLPAAAGVPSPLTPFVGREAERAALSAALREYRLVTAVGPGGVGKTRLALAVASAMSDQFANGVWYADLVSVTDGGMVAASLAETLGLGERQGSSAMDDVLAWVADRATLLVLDNCEHLLDGVVPLVERVLARGPRLHVLATSRARLMVPFERVFLVPGLSVAAAGGGSGDAVQLFLGRAAAVGSPIHLDTVSTKRVAALCHALDGMPLAIELAAARYASLGLDGLETGLHNRLHLLTGGPRADERHRSLRSALDWSFTLLNEQQRAVLRRVSVFAEPFSVTAAAALLAGCPPVEAGHIPAIVAELAEQSLLIAHTGPDDTRYQALEVIRQYGIERLHYAGEFLEFSQRHLQWCLDASAALEQRSDQFSGAWRSCFDEIADELRAALTWAAREPTQRTAAYRLALRLAHLAFLRGMPGESQRRYEQAAQLASGDLAAAAAWRLAAGAAESRHAGNDALTLRRSAAERALRAGDRAGAAADLAMNAERINRGLGLMATPPPVGEVRALIAQARQLHDGDQRAVIRLLIAEAFDGDDADPAIEALSERALELAHQIGDPLAESAALDRLTSCQLARGDVRAAAASAMRRTGLLAPIRASAGTGLEFFDAMIMAAECAVAAGDLAAARRLAERLRDLPFYREQGHLATSRLLLVTVLTGDWTEAVGLAERFREGWERAGRPCAGNLSRGAYAAATVHGLKGDDEGRALWLNIVDGLQTPGRPISDAHFGEFFDALLLLHRGLPRQAGRLLTTPPEEFRRWYSGLWRPWYAALWAEVAAMTDSAEATGQLQRARVATKENVIAAAIVERATALSTPGGDRNKLRAAAAALRAAGCRYQWARTLVMIGGEERDHGESALAAMGASAMVWPPIPVEAALERRGARA